MSKKFPPRINRFLCPQKKEKKRIHVLPQETLQRIAIPVPGLGPKARGRILSEQRQAAFTARLAQLLSASYLCLNSKAWLFGIMYWTICSFCIRSRTDVLIFNKILQEKFGKKWRFLTQTKGNFAEKVYHNIGFWEKTPFFLKISKNRRKLWL
jgi:hypothetical protein